MTRPHLPPAEDCHADDSSHAGMRPRLSENSQDHICAARSIEDYQVTTEFRYYETDERRTAPTTNWRRQQRDDPQSAADEVSQCDSMDDDPDIDADSILLI